MKVFKLMLVAAAVAVSTCAMAQDLSFGVKAGLNFSKFTGDVESGQKSIVGINLGAYADYNLSDMFAVEAGLQFEQKGGKQENNDDGEKSTEQSKVNYFTVPVNARINLALGDNTLYFLAGPTFGIGISGKEKDECDGESEESTIRFGSGEDDDITRMNVGFLIGAGYELSNNIGVRLTYDIGLSNLSGDSKSKCKTGVLGIAVTYKF